MQVKLFISDNESNAKLLVHAPTIGIEKMVATPKDKQKSISCRPEKDYVDFVTEKVIFTDVVCTFQSLTNKTLLVSHKYALRVNSHLQKVA